MNTEMDITENDYQRLMGFVELASFKARMPMITNRLLDRLKAAKLFTQKQIAGSVITMNSRIQVRDLATQKVAEITITYPLDADPRERRVSVFSEIGLALLGGKANDIVSWRVPGGTGRFQVEKIIYQPEAAGDYSL
jgi:regulator of nucleoside diphosphate kinase